MINGSPKCHKNKILDLIPHANSITHLKALCKDCGDGTEAIYTKRLCMILQDSAWFCKILQNYEAFCKIYEKFEAFIPKVFVKKLPKI